MRWVMIVSLALAGAWACGAGDSDGDDSAVGTRSAPTVGEASAPRSVISVPDDEGAVFAVVEAGDGRTHETLLDCEEPVEVTVGGTGWRELVIDAAGRIGVAPRRWVRIDYAQESVAVATREGRIAAELRASGAHAPAGAVLRHCREDPGGWVPDADLGVLAPAILTAEEAGGAVALLGRYPEALTFLRRALDGELEAPPSVTSAEPVTPSVVIPTPRGLACDLVLGLEQLFVADGHPVDAIETLDALEYPDGRRTLNQTPARPPDLNLRLARVQLEGAVLEISAIGSGATTALSVPSPEATVGDVTSTSRFDCGLEDPGVPIDAAPDLSPAFSTG